MVSSNIQSEALYNIESWIFCDVSDEVDCDITMVSTIMMTIYAGFRLRFASQQRNVNLIAVDDINQVFFWDFVSAFLQEGVIDIWSWQKVFLRP